MDQLLDFGGMRMVPGHAFRLGAAPDWRSTIPVLKEYRITQDSNRRLILERLPFSKLQEQLLKLPPANSNTNGTASLRTATPVIVQGALPVRPKTPKTLIHAAQNRTPALTDAFVLDWDLVNTSLHDFTFRRSPALSYVLLGDARLSGTTTLDPGAVIRFDSGSLYLDGPLALPGTASGSGSRKPLLTSVYDETIAPALRSPEPQPPGQYVPALVVRAEDYTNAAQQIETRHPRARIIPDHPNGLSTVRLDRRVASDIATGQQLSIRIRRLGGDLSLPLTIHLATSTNSEAVFDPQTTNFSVMIPANAETIDIPLPELQQGALASALTLQPEANGAYLPGERLGASLLPMNSGNMSPMIMQAPSGMVGWWKAEGNPNDSSGGNHNGTAYGGASCVPGWNGQAFSFDGLNDYIQVQDDPALRMSSALTIELWLKRQRRTGAYEYLVEKGGAWNSGHQNYALQIHGADDGLCLTWNFGYRIGGVVSDLNWHHCAVTALNGQTDPVLYIDGWPQPISQTDRSGLSISLNGSSTLPLHIGAETDYSFYSQTLIDELSIYNQAISQNQIQSIFNSGKAGKTTGSFSCAACPSGIVSWWRAENNAFDSTGNNHGSFNGSYMGGQVGQTFRIVDSSSYVTVPASPSLDVGTGQGFTIEGWMNVYDDDTGGRPVFEWAGPNYGVHLWVNYLGLGNLYANVFDASGNHHAFWSYSTAIQSKTPVHVALSYNHATGNAQVFVNGNSIMTQSVGAITPQTSYPLYLGYRPAWLPGGPLALNGIIDEVSLYNRALSQTEIQAIYNAQSAGKCVGSQPPVITIQPQCQTVVGGGNVTFPVTASGVTALHYQWFHGAAQILGATSSSLTLNGVHSSDAGEYKVVVFNLEGSVTSSAAILTVQKVATPVFNPTGGSYPSSKNVIVTCATSGAVIHYTTTGLEPTQSDPIIASGSGVAVDHNLTLKAKGWKSGWATSDTESEAYRIETSPSDLPPSLTIMPATGASFLASDDVPIFVNAGDPDGTVTDIQLFRDGIKVAETTQSPLQYIMAQAAPGSYTFTARAVDNAGFVTLSSEVTIVVTASGPVLSLRGSQPWLKSVPVTLLASVVGVAPDGLTSLTLNGGAQPRQTGFFTISVPGPLVQGENTFTLVATDNQSRSAQTTAKLYFDSSAPTIAISAPSPGSSITTTRINATGTFGDGFIKQITVNGVPATISGSSWEALNIPIATGANTITAVAQDFAGNASQASVTVTGAGTLSDAIQLTAVPIGGLAPLQVVLQSSASGLPGTIQQVLYDFDGDGVIDQTSTALGQVSHTYTSVGEYFPVVTVATTSGRFSSSGGWTGGSERIRISVQAPPVQISTVPVTDPVDLKLTPDGNLCVLSRSTQTIAEYNPAGSLVRSLAGIGLNPNGIEVDAWGNVYVAVTGENQVRKFNPTANSFQGDMTFNGSRIGRTDKAAGTANGEFNAPFDVAITPEEEIAISDSGNHRIQRFTKFGVFLESFGSPGSGPGQFNTPKGLCYDDGGYLTLRTREITGLPSQFRAVIAAQAALLGWDWASSKALSISQQELVESTSRTQLTTACSYLIHRPSEIAKPSSHSAPGAHFQPSYLYITQPLWQP